MALPGTKIKTISSLLLLFTVWCSDAFSACVKRELVSAEQSYYQVSKAVFDKALSTPNGWLRRESWMHVPKKVCEGFEKKPIIFGGQFRYTKITEADRASQQLAQKQKQLEEKIKAAVVSGNFKEMQRLQSDMQQLLAESLARIQQQIKKSGRKAGAEKVTVKFRINEKRKVLGKKYEIPLLANTAKTFERVNAAGTDRETVTRMLYIGNWRVEDFSKNWNLLRPPLAYNDIGVIRLEITGKRQSIEAFLKKFYISLLMATTQQGIVGQQAGAPASTPGNGVTDQPQDAPGNIPAISVVPQTTVAENPLPVSPGIDLSPVKPGLASHMGQWTEVAMQATRHALNMWKLQAHFQNIFIQGQTAIGSPGCLTGPDLEPWMRSYMASKNVPDNFASFFARPISTAFKDWQQMVTVPGLPWYPMFVAVAMPFAPPTPNIPMPLHVMVSVKSTEITSSTKLANRIYAAAQNIEFSQADREAIEEFTDNLSMRFTTWLASSQVTMVMGMGPVPTFNPPYVPVGLVVGGYIIPSPGHLATAGGI